jgi:putative flippase GtrA
MLTTINQLYAAHKKTFFSFAIVGALATALNFGLFSFFWEGLGLNYLTAVSIAYFLAVVFHFNVNRRFTFRSDAADLMLHAKKYLVMVVINFILTLMIVRFCVEVLQLSPYFGAAFSIGATVCTGYVMSRFWIFK